MKISVDISYYPLGGEHIQHILDFITRLNRYAHVTVLTNGLSTQVFGDFEVVMDVIKTEIHKSFEIPHSVFVLKMVNVDQSDWQ